MSAWSEFDTPTTSQKTAGKEDTQRNGYPYYFIVVGGDWISPSCCSPQAVKLDDYGQPVRSKFPNARQPFWLIDLQPSGRDGSTVDNRLVASWKTGAEKLATMGQHEKQVLNTLKKFLNQSDAAIWYHNGNEDLCSQFGGPHYHIVYENAERPDGSWPVLHNLNIYQTLVKCAKSAGGYARAQRIVSLDGAIKYLSTAPRLYMGTRSKQLGKLRASLLGQPWDSTQPWVDDDGDDFFGIEAVPNAQRGIKRSWNDFETNDDNDFERTINRHAGGSKQDLVPVQQSQPAKLQDVDAQPSCSRPAQGDFGIKELRETAGDRLSKVIESIMRYLMAFTYEEINDAVSNLQPTDPVYITWNRLLKRPGTQAIVKRIYDSIKIEYLCMTFEQMCTEYMKTVDWKSSTYLSPSDSIRALDTWCSGNGMTLDLFCRSVIQVMDKKTGKKNTILVIGPSNAGKTVFLKKPLEKIVKFHSQIGSVGNASQFLWMSVPGTRCVFIEECLLAPEHIETAKLIFGGECAVVDQKCQAPAKVMRTPVFITSNHYPWMLANTSADKVALENRTFVFNVRSDSQLALMTGYLNPAMWYMICATYKKNYDIEDYVLSAEDCLRCSLLDEYELDLEID